MAVSLNVQVLCLGRFKALAPAVLLKLGVRLTAWVVLHDFYRLWNVLGQVQDKVCVVGEKEEFLCRHFNYADNAVISVEEIARQLVEITLGPGM